MSLQLGYFNPDGSQNTTSSPAGNNVPNLVQMVVLNYMALHSATTAAQLAWTLWPQSVARRAQHGQHARQRSAALDPLIMYQPLAGLVNGKVPG